MGHVTVHHGHGFGSERTTGARADVVVPDAGRHRRSAPRSRKPAVWAAIAAALVATGVVLSIGWTTVSQHRAAESVANSPAFDADAAEWIRANLPDGVRLLTEGQVAPTGYLSSPIGQPDQDWHAFDFLLTKPGDQPLDTTAAAVWRSSVPVAIFPGVQIRRILQTAPDETMRTREADRADRLVAGTALLSNPRIAASPQAQATLAAGGLDLRAAAALTALAGATNVEVADIEDIKAEAAADMPARSMTIRVGDSGRATTVLSGMTAAFRADQVIATPDGAFRLHWPLNFAPLPSVN